MGIWEEHTQTRRRRRTKKKTCMSIFPKKKNFFNAKFSRTIIRNCDVLHAIIPSKLKLRKKERPRKNALGKYKNENFLQFTEGIFFFSLFFFLLYTRSSGLYMRKNACVFHFYLLSSGGINWKNSSTYTSTQTYSVYICKHIKLSIRTHTYM